MLRVALLSVLLLLSGAAAAPAPQADQPQAPRPIPLGVAPCAPDAQKFCDKVPYGQGRRIACLVKHKTQLVPACQERLKVLLALQAYGKQQRAKLEAYLAKQKAAAAHGAKPGQTPPPTAPQPAPPAQPNPK